MIIIWCVSKCVHMPMCAHTHTRSCLFYEINVPLHLPAQTRQKTDIIFQTVNLYYLSVACACFCICAFFLFESLQCDNAVRKLNISREKEGLSPVKLSC